jgi:large subunit ribosomal protein L15
MKVNDLKPNRGAKKPRKRIARGVGSGRGRTSTRGHNGMKSRSGYKYRPYFEGGQMPIHRRIPKQGFHNPNRTAYKAVNLEQLQYLAEEKGIQEFDLATFRANGITSKASDVVKVLGRGELKKPIKVMAHNVSASARQAIEQAGGSIQLIPLKRTKQPADVNEASE